MTYTELEEIIRTARSNGALPISHAVIEYRIIDPKAPESAAIDDVTSETQ